MQKAEVRIKTPNSELRTLNSKGFTLIEMIAIMVIVGILAVFLMPRIDFTLSTTASVDGAAYMVASDIRYVQECAMANRVSKRIDFVSGSSVYTFTPSSPLDPSGILPSGVQIGSNYTIIFNSLGEPTTGGGGSVTVRDIGITQTKTISVVNYTGRVYFP